MRFAEVLAISGDRYPQEEALFSVAFNVTSAAECLLLSTAFLGAVLKSHRGSHAVLPSLRSGPKDIRKYFVRQFPGTAIARVVEDLVEDRKRLQILDLRNIMTHRGSIPRTHVVSPRNPGHVRIPADVDEVYLRIEAEDGAESRVKLTPNLGNDLVSWLGAHIDHVITASVAQWKAFA
jgi:hypothetical protein